ncbi:MAG TPA: hypothetical protein VM936_11015 [Pyrinomonadaceae bacterium]|jgi:hypothetical protein|nr:hypothetical protein [Pyrinomonadaceae bacterium]
MTIVKLLTLLCALILIALSHAAALGAQPTQAALVKAWEEVQRDDPETVVFEKSGEGSYKFKTKRFPFDGELKLLKATVSDFSYGGGGDDEDYDVPAGYVMGVIEYDLVGLSEDVVKKYEHSYSGWRTNNTLYFDRQGGEWLSLEKYRAKMAADAKKTTEAYELKEKSKKTSSLWLTVAVNVLPLLLLVGLLAWVMKRTGIRRQREYMKVGLAHMQRSEELLERIAEALEGQKGAGAYARPDAGEYRPQPPA